jgi:uroporphyrinogen-III synthase
MLLALSRLTSASDALDFDALVLVSSAMIRSLLAVVDERSSVEVEAMLAALKVAHV